MSANQITGFFKMYYFIKEVSDEVYFWHTDSHRSFLKVDTIIYGVCVARHAQSTQYKKFACLCNVSRAISPEKRVG